MKMPYEERYETVNQEKLRRINRALDRVTAELIRITDELAELQKKVT